MNIMYLNTLPEVENKFNVKLQDDEKVIFTAKPTCFGTETGRWLGSSNGVGNPNSKITLTNKRLIADNNVGGVWIVDIANDIVDCTKVESGKFILKSTYILVNLNKEIIFNNETEKMNGFRFYFNKKDIVKFETIMNNLLK
ncbi:MAG: hypothetical protein J6D03_11345 [Clostridia bacterium]|nr:hypothetical protein [Clostridia bacterium]